MASPVIIYQSIIHENAYTVNILCVNGYGYRNISKKI